MSRILLVCNEYPPASHGGQGTFVRQLGRLLSKRHTVFVIGFYPGVGEVELERDGDVTVYRQRHPDHRGFFGILRNLLHFGIVINRFIKEHKIDLAEFPDSGALYLFVTKAIPVFVRLHNTERYFQRAVKKRRSRVLEIFENISFWQRIYIISVSEYVKEQFLDYYRISVANKKRLTVIHNGIDVSVFSLRRPITERSRSRIVFAGTVKPIKGIQFLIKALCSVRKEMPALELHIYGNDSSVNGRSYMEQLLEENEVNGIVDGVFFHGAFSNERLADIYNDTFLCVFPSLGESFGLVVIEAMACGCIVINTSYGAGKELIVDGKDGFLVFPDNVDLLAEKIREALFLRDAETMSGAASKSANAKFSMELCVARTEQFYNSTLG